MAAATGGGELGGGAAGEGGDGGGDHGGGLFLCRSEGRGDNGGGGSGADPWSTPPSPPGSMLPVNRAAAASEHGSQLYPSLFGAE